MWARASPPPPPPFCKPKITYEQEIGLKMLGMAILETYLESPPPPPFSKA